MAASRHLQPKQFAKRKKRDPNTEEKPKFGGGKGVKTMKVERGKGLPPAPAKHPHKRHSGGISRRAH